MAESSEKFKRKNYLEAHRRMLFWTGLNRPVSTHRIINLLFIIRLIYIVGTYCVLITGCIAHVIIVNEYDLLASSINVLQLIIYVMGTLHVIYYEIRHKKIYNLIARIQEAFRFSSNTGHYTMEKPMRIDTWRSTRWIVLCASASTCWFALAMARGDDPIPVWAPVNLRQSPYYQIDIILQFTGQFNIGALGGCFGSFYMSTLALLRYQFEIVSCSLEHVTRFAALKMQRRVHGGNERISSKIDSKNSALKTEDDNIKISGQCECCTEEFIRFFETFEKRRFENTLSPSEARVYEEELYDALKDCIVHHQNIVKLKDVIEDFFGPAMLIRFGLSTMMLCFTIYSSSKIMAREDFSPIDMTFLSLVEYYMIGVGEMFIFCYVADRLFHTSITIRNVAFESLPWHGGSVTKKFISTWKIFHLCATKPTNLRTPFYVVSLDVLRTIFRTSFSFYTLLRRLQKK